MANVKVRVLDAVVDGSKRGSTLMIDERTATHLASIGYVEIIKEETPKAADEKGSSAPKKSTARKRKKAEE